MINPDGSVHKEHTPNPVTGTTFKVPTLTGEAIQTAIDDAKFGDEVYLPAGEYIITSRINLKSGVNIRGEEGTLLKQVKNNDYYNESTLFSSSDNNILISNLLLTTEFDGTYSENSNATSNVDEGPNYSIKISDSGAYVPSYNITIDNVIVENFSRMGIRIESSHDIVVKNSTFRKAIDVGGGGAGYGVSIQGEG